MQLEPIVMYDIALTEHKCGCVGPPTLWLALPLICWNAHVFILSLPSRFMDLREVCETHHGNFTSVDKCLPNICVVKYKWILFTKKGIRHVRLTGIAGSPWAYRRHSDRVQMPPVFGTWVFSVTILLECWFLFCGCSLFLGKIAKKSPKFLKWILKKSRCVRGKGQLYW